MSIPFPKIFYINLAIRQDRRIWMERQLNGLGLEFERVEAEIMKESAGFQNKPTRGVFKNHVEIIERSFADKRPYVVLEDDARIINFELAKYAWNKVHEKPIWDMLYFHGIKEPRIGHPDPLFGRLYHSFGFHAYVVNHERPHIRRILREEYDRRSDPNCTLKRDHASHIDYFSRHNLMFQYRVYGCYNKCIFQDGAMWGSDTYCQWRDEKGKLILDKEPERRGPCEKEREYSLF